MPTIDDPDICDFLDECGWAATTLEVVRSNLARWERWLSARRVAPMDATFRDLRTYLAEREAAGVGGATRHKDWQNIRRLYQWAARPVDEGGAGILAADPMTRAGAPFVPEPATRIATPDMAARLEDHFAARVRRAGRDSAAGELARRDAAMVSLLMRSGLRSVEVTGIDLADLVRNDRGQLVACRVPAAFAKSRRTRLVPLADETPRLLERYLRRRTKAPGPLFLGRKQSADAERRLTARGVQAVVRRAGAAVGLVISAHDLRRGWAVTSAGRGVDRGWLKIIGGWERDVTLDRYLGAKKQQVAVTAFLATVADGGPQRGRLRGA